MTRYVQIAKENDDGDTIVVVVCPGRDDRDFSNGVGPEERIPDHADPAGQGPGQVAEKTLVAIQSFTSAPIRIVVNTHIHGDHTGANAFFAKQGALIFAQENLRNEMLRPPRRADGQSPPAPDMAGVPVVTYHYNPEAPGQPAVTINMDRETVDFIPMMPSHTAGDTIVRFRNANVIYIEDFYRNFGYPFADPTNGGSIKGMLEAVDLFDQVAGPDTILVPATAPSSRKESSRRIAPCSWTSWRR
jgi:glyoxylase-like metal-dependent hydrolase (beta-lactamase superfamily II)